MKTVLVIEASVLELACGISAALGLRPTLVDTDEIVWKKDEAFVRLYRQGEDAKLLIEGLDELAREQVVWNAVLAGVDYDG